MPLEYKLGAVEMKFADIIWNNQPLSSGELVKICEKELKWKKSTTYTILKRLCDRKIFENQNGTVSALLSKNEFSALQSREFMEVNFEGSLPKFLAAFSEGKGLSKNEIEEIQSLIDEMRKKHN